MQSSISRRRDDAHQHRQRWHPHRYDLASCKGSFDASDLCGGCDGRAQWLPSEMPVETFQRRLPSSSETVGAACPLLRQGRKCKTANYMRVSVR